MQDRTGGEIISKQNHITMPVANLDIQEIERIVESLKAENTSMKISTEILGSLPFGSAEFKANRKIRVAQKTEANTIIIRKLEAIHTNAMESRVVNEALSIINQSKN